MESWVRLSGFGSELPRRFGSLQVRLFPLPLRGCALIIRTPPSPKENQQQQKKIHPKRAGAPGKDVRIPGQEEHPPHHSESPASCGSVPRLGFGAGLRAWTRDVTGVRLVTQNLSSDLQEFVSSNAFLKMIFSRKKQRCVRSISASACVDPSLDSPTLCLLRFARQWRFHAGGLC